LGLPRTEAAEPRSATGNKAPPAAASALSTPPLSDRVPGAIYRQGEGGRGLKNSDLALPEGDDDEDEDDGDDDDNDDDDGGDGEREERARCELAR
jgi:hypothetical protein